MGIQISETLVVDIIKIGLDYLPTDCTLSWCNLLIVLSQLFVLFNVKVLMLIVFSCYLFLVKIKPKLPAR